VLSHPEQSHDLLRGEMTLVQVVSDVDGEELQDVVRDLRDIDAGGIAVEVGGSAAASVDTLDGIRAGIVPAFLFVVIGSYLILLLTFGSVFLPLKAIFGLSMDYEVLMLSRIQEEYQRTGDNTASVAFGLEKTAKVITGAAAIMIVAFGAFMLADIPIIKSMGFGLALAVLIDATIVRALLVPATMRLMGDWNWWAPRPVKSLVDRIGLSHAEPARVGAGAGD
jgi:RND superfamily putative drug exporter